MEPVETEQKIREEMGSVEETRTVDNCAPSAKQLCHRENNDEMEKIPLNKKLILVLDLDNTLVDTRPGKNLSPNELHLFSHPDLKVDRRRSLFTWIATSFTTMTKLRPSLESFLKQASTLYDMYIYTESNRHDAICIAKLLDPNQEYFHNRIISREDSNQPSVKRLDDLQHDERFVVIVDDNEEVWQEDDRDNLIHVAKYQYFSSSNDSGSVKPLSESKMNEDEAGNVLDGVLDVLTHAHRTFFDDQSSPSRDVRVILKEMKRTILKGCKIVFSSDASPEAKGKPVRTMAEEMGAITCTMNNVDASVTHVVSVSLKSKSACWAVKNNKFLVTPLWVESAYYSWRRQNEGDFPIDAKATDQTNGATTEQKRKRDMEKINGARSEKKVKKVVEEKGSRTQGGVKKETSGSPNVAEAGVPRNKEAEMKKDKNVGATNEKGAGKANNNGRSFYQDMTHFRGELAEARRDRDEARKGTTALLNMVTQLCTQVSYLTELCEARPFMYERGNEGLKRKPFAKG